jgi:hypothetical protein
MDQAGADLLETGRHLLQVVDLQLDLDFGLLHKRS